jgi:hypothetical protein
LFVLVYQQIGGSRVIARRPHTVILMEVDEEKKPFDAETAGADEETQPEPDEHMMTDSATGRVWIVKARLLFSSICLARPNDFIQIPRFLMERWSAVNQEEVHLATIRVYTESSRIKLFLPPNPDHPDEPEEYELDMVHESVDNQLVVAEKEKEPGSRARTTILAGKVKHECNLRPVFTEKYRRRMRERVRKANTPQRQIKMIEEVTPGGRGGINMLSSGVSNTTGFSDLVVCPFNCSARNSYKLTLSLFSEIKTKTPERTIRAHGSHTEKPATRPPLQALPRKRNMVYQSSAGENTTARSLSQRSSERDRISSPKW